VVGGMLFTIACLTLVPVLYSFYGARPPREGGSGLTH